MKTETRKCTYFKKLGHTADRCWLLHGKPTGTSKDESTERRAATTTKQFEKRCMTATQSASKKFYLDSGATDHLCNHYYKIIK